MTGMEFYGYHGCLAEERKTGQPFVVDAVLFLDLRRAGQRDALEDTVNYAEVFECIRRIAEGEPKLLIEALAEEMAEVVLGQFPALREIVLTVHKPQAPLPGRFQDVSVTVERTRG